MTPLKLWTNLKSRERAFAYATGTVAILCLFFHMAIVPTVDRLEQIQRDITLQTKQLAAHRRSLSQRDRVFQIYQHYAHLTRAAASDEEEASRLLKEVESLARVAGVTVVNLKSRPVEASGMVKWYRVDMEAESPLESLTRFIYQVEQSPLLLRVERFDVKQDEKLQGPLKCTLQISKVVIP